MKLIISLILISSCSTFVPEKCSLNNKEYELISEKIQLYDTPSGYQVADLVFNLRTKKYQFIKREQNCYMSSNSMNLRFAPTGVNSFTDEFVSREIAIKAARRSINFSQD